MGTMCGRIEKSWENFGFLRFSGRGFYFRMKWVEIFLKVERVYYRFVFIYLLGLTITLTQSLKR